MRRETRSDRELLRHVADRTLHDNFGVWHWGDAIAIDGLLDASAALDEASIADAVTGLLTAWAERKIRSGMTWADFLAPAHALLATHARTGDSALLAAARSLGDLMLAAPRGRAGAPLHRADLADRRNWVWIDTTYHAPPFLCRLGVVLEDSRYIDAGMDSLVSHIRVLRDTASGFYHHAYDDGDGRRTGTYWARGQGWIALGLADTLHTLPGNDVRRAQLHDLLADLLDRLAAVQDSCGLFNTVINERNTHLETSIAAMVVAAVGSLSPTERRPEWDGMANAAWQAVRERVDAEGNVLGVTRDTFARFDNPQHYRDCPLGVSAWGQGSFLRAAAAVAGGQTRPGVR